MSGDPAQSLVPGQLAIAGNLAATKDHIVLLLRSAHDDDVAELSQQRLSAKARTAAISKIDPRRRDQWSARGICGVRGQKVTFGNRQTYYWRLRQSTRADAVCNDCWREWRGMGRPEIAGWDQATRLDPEAAWPWPLPFGWRPAPVDGHPWDVPAGEPVERIKDPTGKVVGQHRTELRRWTRGPRIVRLVQEIREIGGDVDVYAARHWRAGTDPDQERYYEMGSLLDGMQGCQKLMARGGY